MQLHVTWTSIRKELSPSIFWHTVRGYYIVLLQVVCIIKLIPWVSSQLGFATHTQNEGRPSIHIDGINAIQEMCIAGLFMDILYNCAKKAENFHPSRKKKNQLICLLV